MRKSMLLVLVCCATCILRIAHAITVSEAMSPLYAKYHQLVGDPSITTRRTLYSKLADFIFNDFQRAEETIPAGMSYEEFGSYLIEVRRLHGLITGSVRTFVHKDKDAELTEADRAYLHRLVEYPAAAAARPTPPPPAAPAARPTMPPPPPAAPAPAARPARRRSPSPDMMREARILLDNVKRATGENIDQLRKQWRDLTKRARRADIIAVLKQVEAEIEAVDKRVIEQVLKEREHAVAVPPPPPPAARPARRRSPSPVSVRDFMTREQQIYRDIDHMSVDQLRNSLIYLTARRPRGLSPDQQTKVENAIVEIADLIRQFEQAGM